MTHDQNPRPARSLWTGARIALALVVFVLLATALSSSCNPGANYNAPAGPAANATPANGAQPRPPAAAATPQALTDALKQTEMQTIDGKPLRLADYAGKVVVLDLWATWCGPCRMEIPELVALHNDYKARGVEVLGLTIEGLTAEDKVEKEPAVRRFANEFKINYTVGWAEESLARAFLMPSGSIPQTYIIAPDGRIVGHFTGYSPALAPRMRQLIDQTLAGS